jgi:DNA-binding winged helix-turn-helix (wHTH) protein/TolB-like protein/Flp pilus assembly protein TadD
MPLETKVLYEFGGFRLDPSQRLLVREGKPVSLTPKGFELLLVLIQNGGRLLTKDELMSRVWKDSFVEEANLTVNISAVRKALGDTQDGQEFIETVPKHGYRFVGTVKEVEDPVPAKAAKVVAIRPPLEESAAGAPPASSPPAVISGKKRSFPAITGIAVAVLLALIAAAGYWIYRQRSERSQTPEGTSRRLAILPFQNLRHDPDSDFLGYSLADAVITELGYVQSLRVRPSYAIARYRSQNTDISKVAADLNVDTLLTGNFIRDGDDLRITCQLLDASSQNIIWKGAFDLKYDKLLKVQDTVSQEIIGALELHLSPSEAARIRNDAPVNPVAYEYYLRGLDFYGRHNFPQAIVMLEKSRDVDPNYALTWAYLGASYTSDAAFELGGREQYRKAQAAYERALRIQPAQIEARMFLANLLVDNGKVEQAVPLLLDALHTNPNRADIHWELGYAYRFGGMLPQSVAECELARQLDPTVKANGAALNTYLYLGEYEKFLRSLPNDNDTAFLVFYRGFGEFYLKQWELAARDFDRANALDPTLYTQIGKALGASIAHRESEGIAILKELEKTIAERGVGDAEATYKMAQAYAVLGDRQSSLRVFADSIEHGFFAYPYFVRDPLLDNIRHESEFERLLKLAQQRHEAFKRAFF